jgi:hypothetical protein
MSAHAPGAPDGGRRPPVVRSFLMGGFECSTHVLGSGRRLDLIASTRHDALVEDDYLRLQSMGMRSARDGIRWHVVEPRPGHFDFSSARPMLRAARATDTQVIWDLVHFGWPDHVDVLGQDFPERLGAFAHAFAEVLGDEGEETPFVAPVNEISFLSFAGGQAGFFNPFVRGRGDELKRQFVRGALAAGGALRAVLPGTRLVHTDPVIHVRPRRDRPGDLPAAEAHRDAQFHAWDMIAGRREPELGGDEAMLDILGLNYYVHNQWYFPGGHGTVVRPSSPDYRPPHELFLEVHRRYGRPMFIAETGIENAERPIWLRYIARETRRAARLGADLQGVCLYPIVNHPGWEDDRHCHNGLWDYADEHDERALYRPLAEEVERQRRIEAGVEEDEDVAGVELEELDAIARSIAEATETSRTG